MKKLQNINKKFKYEIDKYNLKNYNTAHLSNTKKEKEEIRNMKN